MLSNIASIVIPFVLFLVGNMFYITMIWLLYLIWKELRIMNGRTGG